MRQLFSQEVYMREKSLKYYVVKYKAYLIAFFSAVVLIAIILGVTLTNGDNPSVNVGTEEVNFVLPVSNASITKQYNSDELQYNKTLNCWEIHKGIDLLAQKGDDVLACYNGTVKNIYSNSLEGTVIEVSHEGGLTSIYMGLDTETSVKVGDEVLSGQKLGKVGLASANETDDGTHIHFELLKDNEKVDPLNYINIDLKG